MKIDRNWEAVIISALSKMDDRQLLKVLKSALDGRRRAPAQEKKPEKKLHWKTAQKLQREKLGKKKPQKKKKASTKKLIPAQA